MNPVRSLRNALCGLAVAGLSFSAATSPATAAEEQTNETRVASVQMEAVKLTASTALAYGYDVRTDADGQQWAMDSNTPEGDFTHAVPIPEDERASTQDRIIGNCGSSWVYLNGKEGYRSVYTGYEINPNWGAPVSQDWSVAIHSSIDFESYDFSGLAVWGSQTWFVSQMITTQAIEGRPLSALAGGSVLTTENICVSGSPTDTITG